jgi:hypothetical protein
MSDSDWPRDLLEGVKPPDRIDLSDCHTIMNDLWEKSVRDIARGEVKEHGGTLILDKNGKLTIINLVEGSSREIDLNLRVGEGETFVGVFHTHPHASGLTGMAFSGPDMVLAIYHRCPVTLVQSGDHVFALVRTEKTVSSVERSELIGELEALYRAGIRDKMSRQEALLVANLNLCAKYGLAFYWSRAFDVLKGVYRP